MLHWPLILATLLLFDSPVLSEQPINSPLASSSEEGLTSQHNLNKFLEEVIAGALEKVKSKEGRVVIPDIYKKFKTGEKWWKIKGEFTATEGIFEDIRTIKRDGDVYYVKDGLNYTISSKFKISKSSIKYDNYRVKYSFFKVSGDIAADIDGVGLSVTVHADYNQTPCKISLQEVRVSELGEVDVEVNGLGSLDSLLSRIIIFVVEKYEEDVIDFIERELRDAIEGNLDHYNCDKNGPW